MENTLHTEGRIMEQKNEERRAVACHYYEYYLALEKKLQRLEIRIARERYEELKN